MPAVERTTLTPKWSIKFIVFFVLVVGFGIYSVYDATIGYPNRGRRDAEYKEWQYLQALETAHQIDFYADVADPVSTLSVLSSPDRTRDTATALANPDAPGHDQAAVDHARREWLDSLRRVGELKPEFTTFPRTNAREEVGEANQRLTNLSTEWTTSGGTKRKPKPLSDFDIASQWILAAICLGLASWLGIFWLKVRSVRYGWDPAESRLYLPNGTTLIPTDIVEFDKRKWDKYLIFLTIRGGHDGHSGETLRLDLLRYRPLEEWILKMESIVNPEAEADGAAQGAEAAVPDSEPTGAGATETTTG